MKPLNHSTVVIRPMQSSDLEAVRGIYLEGIRTGNATFGQSAPDWNQWEAAHLATCRFVAPSTREVIGWAALNPVSSRCVYRGVAETSVYVAERAHGQRWGLRC